MAEHEVLIPLVLVVAVIAGAFLNVIRGVIGADYFDYKLFVGSLITAGFAAITTAVALDFVGVTDVLTLILLGLVAGFGSDFSISRLKRQKLKNSR